MKKKNCSIFLILLSLCSCTSYKGVTPTKGREILETINEYTNKDVTTAIEITHNTNVFDANESLISERTIIYQMNFDKNYFHIGSNNYVDDNWNIYGSKHEELGFIVLEEKNEEKNGYKINETIYQMFMLNYMGYLRKMFVTTSNIQNNMEFLISAENNEIGNNLYKLTSNGKGNLKIERKDKNNDDLSFLYNYYRFENKEETRYATNYDSELFVYQLAENEYKRFISTKMKFKKIDTSLPSIADYTFKDNDFEFPSFSN